MAVNVRLMAIYPSLYVFLQPETPETAITWNVVVMSEFVDFLVINGGYTVYTG